MLDSGRWPPGADMPRLPLDEPQTRSASITPPPTGFTPPTLGGLAPCGINTAAAAAAAVATLQQELDPRIAASLNAADPAATAAAIASLRAQIDVPLKPSMMASGAAPQAPIAQAPTLNSANTAMAVASLKQQMESLQLQMETLQRGGQGTDGGTAPGPIYVEGGAVDVE